MPLFKKDRGAVPSKERSELEENAATRAPGGRPDAGAARGGGAEAKMGQAGASEGISKAGTEQALLGRGTRISGKITFEGRARIDGQVEGEILAADVLEIGEAALVNAQIHGTTIIVQGKVTGDLVASKKLEIRAPGKLYGNVTTPSLIIEEGVVFEGHCSMGAKENKSDGRVTLLAKEEGSEEAKAAPNARAAAASDS